MSPVAVVACLFALLAWLVPPPSAAAALHPWEVPAPQLEKKAYFSNLQDGASIETPYVLRFGLTGMGLAAISGAAPGTGHHHLLVDRELPLDFDKPLPFNDQYIHFGKGQMETVLTLAPGRYTLRLVLANQRHIPEFVYSDPVHVTVTRRRADVSPDSLVRPGVAILQPADGAHLQAPFRIGFHAAGYAVSAAAVPAPGSGHFRLRLSRNAGKEEVLDFDNGRTEAWLKPPEGQYVAALDFVDNQAPERVLAKSAPVAFDVR